jgi:hypothetical protein
MTIRQKYKENESLIAAYKDFYELRNYQEDRQHPDVKRVDSQDEDELMTEIARLLNQNKQIRTDAIVQPSILDNEYYDHTIRISAQFDTSGGTGVFVGQATGC